MKIKVAEYVAQKLVENGIKDIFTVVGGGAMHLNDAFGNHSGIHCIYNHHEQACAMAAESYARVEGNMAVACVTTGPGGTNAITGVLCAWQDNIPLLVISGQVRYNTTVESTGLALRQFGEQEHYIVSTVKTMTKYAVTVKKAEDIRYELEKCIYLAKSGRRGPCWLDIPLDVQGNVIETEELTGFIPEKKVASSLNKEDFLAVIRRVEKPVIVAGSAIRTANVRNEFMDFISRAHVPVLAANGSNDILPLSNEMYYGNFGMIGGRSGNFMIQNADCILVLGCRMAFKHIGFNYEEFSPNSYKIVVDVDAQELQKDTLKIDMPVCMDLKDFFECLSEDEIAFSSMSQKWKDYCDELREAFPIWQEKYNISDSVNPYFFAKQLKQNMKSDGIVVVGNSCACDCVRQCGVDQEGQRLWGNTNCGTMGYDLPGAIGAAVAAKRDVYCVTGDGSIQMNLQELQTIVHNNLPIKIFIHNNEGYFAIVQTHTNFFGRLSGCTRESGISFPSFEKIAYAYGIPYFRAENHEELEKILPKVISQKGYVICEIISDTNQPIEPKMKSKVLENGQIVSPKLDDLYPFLDEDVYNKYAKYYV